MAKRKHGGRPWSLPLLPVVEGLEPTWTEGRNGTRVRLVRRWTAKGAVQHFCGSVLKGKQPQAGVTNWIAQCLMQIEADPNHRARPAFGLESRGRPADDDLVADILLYVGLARRWGHTLEQAIDSAARDFKKSRSVIEKYVRGMRTHLASYGQSDDEMAQILLQHGRKLPRRLEGVREQQAAEKRPATRPAQKRRKSTPAKK